MIRFGIGYDAHRLVTGRPLVLGGVTVPHDRGLEGHSDGDAAVHAIIDALLGAAALGDLGGHFPEGDPAFPPGVSSLLLLEHAVALLRESGWRVGNVDATIVAQKPALAPHAQKMRQALAEAMDVSIACVSVKATTTDGMGFTGDGQGIAAHAVASLEDRTS
jgi:2-C-methyl-D-erythritol 2,4-cyclodiphosphate synthase